MNEVLGNKPATQSAIVIDNRDLGIVHTVLYTVGEGVKWNRSLAGRRISTIAFFLDCFCPNCEHHSCVCCRLLGSELCEVLESDCEHEEELEERDTSHTCRIKSYYYIV